MNHEQKIKEKIRKEKSKKQMARGGSASKSRQNQQFDVRRNMMIENYEQSERGNDHINNQMN